MVDLAALALIVAFFAIALVFIKACERIIGPDVELTSTTRDDTADERQSDGDHRTRPSHRREGRR